jgi:hypothetical protein
VTWTAYYATTADTFGTLASPTRTQIATGTFTVTSTVTNYTASISVPSAATTGIEIVLTVGAQTSGTWTIGNVQLEAGSLATPFERLPIGETLMLCQRYYFSTQAAIYGSISFVGQYVAWTSVLPSTMRAAPTATITNTTPSGSMNGGPVVANTYAGSIGLTSTAFSAFASNGACGFTLNCSAEL